MTFAKAVVRRLPRYHLPLERPVVDGGVIAMPAGDFVQVANGEVVRFVAHLEFRAASQASRGDHWHRVRTEVCTVIRGRLRVRYQDIDSGERIEVVLEPGDQVTVQPRCAHSYLALEDADVIECSTHPFDPDDSVAFRFD